MQLPTDKAELIVRLLEEAIDKDELTLLEMAQLHGCLNNAAYVSRRGHSTFINFQSQFRCTIIKKYQATRGYLQRQNRWHPNDATEPLNDHLEKKFANLDLNKEVVPLLWWRRAKIPPT